MSHTVRHVAPTRNPDQHRQFMEPARRFATCEGLPKRTLHIPLSPRKFGETLHMSQIEPDQPGEARAGRHNGPRDTCRNPSRSNRHMSHALLGPRSGANELACGTVKTGAPPCILEPAMRIRRCFSWVTTSGTTLGTTGDGRDRPRICRPSKMARPAHALLAGLSPLSWGSSSWPCVSGVRKAVLG